MKVKPRFSWKKRGMAFRFAWKGIAYAFRTQHNMWLHMSAVVLVLALGIWLDISALQWLAIIICVGLVLALELVNTAIEVLADHLHPQLHPKIALVKDLAAGAVLVAAVTAFIVGCWIFVPKIVLLLASVNL